MVDYTEGAGYQYHTHVKKGDVGRYVILTGDPGRCESISKLFDNPKFIAYNREYNTYTGTLCGEKVTVMSHGIGGASTAIAIEELYKCGALCSEMESSTLFIVGSYLRARTGAVLLVVANQERAKKGLSNPQAHDMEIVYKTTIEAIKSLITMDKTQ